MKKRQFEKLIIWQRSHRFAVSIYKTSAFFPKTEEYALTSQLRRAAFSVAANIAEGSVKSNQSFLNHLLIALGSLEEVRYFLILAHDLGYIEPKGYETIRAEGDEIGKMLFAFIPVPRRPRVHPWMNWPSGTGCSPQQGASWVPRLKPWGSIKRMKELSK